MTALQRVLTSLAWLFALGTLLTLVLILVLHWPGTGSSSAIMSIAADGRAHKGFGVHYVGVAGTALVAGEALLVLSGIVLSVMRGATPRRIGHAILVAWSALWLANAVYLSVAAASGLTVLDTALLITVPLLLSAATITRAARNWTQA